MEDWIEKGNQSGERPEKDAGKEKKKIGKKM